MNDIDYFLNIIRELERNVGVLQQQLDDERKRSRRPILIENHVSEVVPEPHVVPHSKPKLPALKAGEHATYIEGVAYEGRNMRRQQGDRRFRHFPITTIAVFATDADARKYMRERDNPGYPKRLGSVIVEVVDKQPVIRRRRSPPSAVAQPELPGMNGQEEAGGQEEANGQE